MTPKKSRSRSLRGTTRQSAATIHDVAARAGVSVATVSRVLNGKQVVRESTSREVMSAVRSLRYVPNLAARSLSIRQSHTIGVVLPDVHGEFFSEVLRGIDVAARAAGYHSLVSGSHSDVREMTEVIQAMRGRVDGLIVMAPNATLTRLGQETAGDLPLVLLNSASSERDVITIDNSGGARAMMSHLFSLGHERIAFIKGPAGNVDARERLKGYRQAMRTQNVPPVEIDGDFSEEAGSAAGRAAASHRPRPTAIFAANDSMAVGAIAALASDGVGIPSSMAVVGFDDIPIARYITPALTTVHIDIADLGRRAFQLLLDAIAHPAKHTPRRESVAATLVVRESCGGRLRRMTTASAGKTVLHPKR